MLDNVELSPKQKNPVKQTGTVTISNTQEQSGIPSRARTVSPIRRKGTESFSNNDNESIRIDKMVQSGMRVTGRTDSLNLGEDFELKATSIKLKKEDIQGSRGEWSTSSELCTPGIKKVATAEDLERRIKELECEGLLLEKKCEEEKMTRIKALKACYQDKREWRQEKVILIELNKKLGRMIEQIYKRIKDVKQYNPLVHND